MDIKEELSYWQEASQELVKMKNEKLSNIK